MRHPNQMPKARAGPKPNQQQVHAARLAQPNVKGATIKADPAGSSSVQEASASSLTSDARTDASSLLPIPRESNVAPKPKIANASSASNAPNSEQAPKNTENHESKSVSPPKPTPPAVTERIFATQFGLGTFSSGLAPEEAVFVKAELSRAREGLVLGSSLHLCYLASPIFQNSVEPNWPLYYQVRAIC